MNQTFTIGEEIDQVGVEKASKIIRFCDRDAVEKSFTSVGVFGQSERRGTSTASTETKIPQVWNFLRHVLVVDDLLNRLSLTER